MKHKLVRLSGTALDVVDKQGLSGKLGGTYPSEVVGYLNDQPALGKPLNLISICEAGAFMVLTGLVKQIFRTSNIFETNTGWYAIDEEGKL